MVGNCVGINVPVLPLLLLLLLSCPCGIATATATDNNDGCFCARCCVGFLARSGMFEVRTHNSVRLSGGGEPIAVFDSDPFLDKGQQHRGRRTWGSVGRIIGIQIRGQPNRMLSLGASPPTQGPQGPVAIHSRTPIIHEIWGIFQTTGEGRGGVWWRSAVLLPGSLSASYVCVAVGECVFCAFYPLCLLVYLAHLHQLHAQAAMFCLLVCFLRHCQCAAVVLQIRSMTYNSLQ